MNSQLAQRSRRSEGGYVLVAAAAIVVVLLGTGLAFMRWSTDEAMQSEHASAAIQAYYLAQMGVVEQGYQWLRNRQEAELPAGEIILSGRQVPGFGRYADVKILPLTRSGNDDDYFTGSKWFRIAAVGITTLPWYENGNEEIKEVSRRAVLYVKVRNFVDYMYLSDNEMTTFGDRIRFWHGDTLNGRVHSNFQIAIMGDPIFYEQVTQAGDWNDFEHGAGYAPWFAMPPIFHAQPVEIPELAANLRSNATHYESPPGNKQQRLVISQSTCRLYTWNIGEGFDSLEATMTTFPVGPSMCFFTEAPLELKGTEITGKITIGSAQTIRLIDDVRVGGPTSGPPQYRVSAANPNFVGIVSEGDVKVANTPENGRANSAGLGNGQTNPALSDIVITAAIAALGNTNVNGTAGSFTFENQNDADSGYVFCSPPQGGPDDRGQIFLYGSVTQRRRGYVHRSNCSSTGYLKQYIYDERFLRQRPPCFFSAVDTTGRALFDFVQWGQGVEELSTSQRVRVRYN